MSNKLVIEQKPYYINTKFYYYLIKLISIQEHIIPIYIFIITSPMHFKTQSFAVFTTAVTSISFAQHVETSYN